MTDDTTAEVRAVVETLLADRRLATNGSITRLGGLTNRVFAIEHMGQGVVVRLPGPGTAAYIDRQAERRNAEAAAQAGVSPHLLAFDPAGVMITELVAARTMSAARFRDLDAVARAALAFRQLHARGAVFSGTFDLFEKIDEYQAHLDRLGVEAPDGYESARARAAQVRDALGQGAVASVACHCDPLAENFLDNGQRMWIVDWEYSGNNDPMWDLGDLSVEAEFGPDQDEALLRAYFVGGPPAAARGRMILFKAMADLLWTLWGVIQHANNNPADDFWAYAVNRLGRCCALMERREFAAALAAVRRA